ncbi:hypothetical protein BX666DRAFT_1973038 [Dichotomocladium elegans]|nr:hypothetical protein BX666DRAFT_1973038 [Dichotomocladium elegans]
MSAVMESSLLLPSQPGTTIIPKVPPFVNEDEEKNEPCGPCTPPLSPNPDLVTDMSTIQEQKHQHQEGQDSGRHPFAAPSTPPPSRSSTVEKTHTTYPARPPNKFAEYSVPIQQSSTCSTNESPAIHPLVGPPDVPAAIQPMAALQTRMIKESDTSRRASRRFSTMSIRKRPLSGTTTMSDLDPEEQAALKAEINARRYARRASIRKRKTYADTTDDEDENVRVHIGTRIAEGHRNYQLMYDMLTGIRIAVGRVSAKLSRDLTAEDFRAAHKLVFDITGNELTPGVKYDFKFKDYAPWVFRHLREKFHIDAADYMMSLTNKYILSELTSPGKSGSFFYYSRDYRFIIKTISHTEHIFLRRVLRDYYNHICHNPNTLLSRFYGLHRIKLPHGKKTHFIVMGNVFPGNKDVHLTFDLKGSTFARFTPENKHNAVLKDQNWINRKERIQLGPEKRQLLFNQLKKDVEFLTRLNIMDYSFLVGIHDLKRGNSDMIRDNHLHIVKTDHMERQMSFGGSSRRGSNADIVRKALLNTSPIQLHSSDLPELPSEERRWCIFYAEDGGFISTDEEDKPGLSLYFVGIIDILTPYNFVKRSEHMWKSITQDKNAISAVNPKMYGKRFLGFMKNAMAP